jgi:GNAT superfamily N-acetyltransferase
VLRIRLMTAGDLPLGLRLRDQAGWNQTEVDWRRFLDFEPDGCFVAELDGTPVGTTTTTRFGSVAWVALVLVDVAVRGRGIGTALVSHTVRTLEDRGMTTMRLDATPLGRPVYEKLGFSADYELARYGGVPGATSAAADTELVGPGQLDEIFALDQTISGTDRARLLTRLYEEQWQGFRAVRRQGVLEGFVAVRLRAHGWQIGPCMARGEVGARLLRDAGYRCAGQPVVVDIPTGNNPSIAVAEALGLTVQRSLLRMTRGPRVSERLPELWASAGPEKG